MGRLRTLLRKSAESKGQRTMKFRKEHDIAGEMMIPVDALYGIHTARAMENFPLSRRVVNPSLIHAYGMVKLACARTNHQLGYIENGKAEPIFKACEEMIAGELDIHIKVDALQGGAGTSTNMNVNEVIANRALEIAGKTHGDYDFIHPIDTINLHQSTNDTYPTALKIAAIADIKKLESALVKLLEAFQKKEKEMTDIVKVGRTQLQDAVLTTLGKSMGAYAEAFGRDRWRIYKCEERLRVVNLGGTAIGTGLAAPRKYIFKVVDNLKEICSFGIARSENLIECTQNCDAFVEVAGILNACASNMIKISSDLRLMSSGPDAGLGELVLPARQAGSSIMPGKINPVIPEAVTQCGMKSLANLTALSQAASSGCLELNPFMPLIADSLLDTIQILTGAAEILRKHCVEDMKAVPEHCAAHVKGSTATLTALVGKIGYAAAEKIAEELKSGKYPGIKEAVTDMKLMSAAEFDEAVSPEAVTRLGSVEAK